MLQREKDIRSKVDRLTKEKNDRLKHVRQLAKMDEQLCALLAMAPHYVPSGMVSSTQLLAELEEHIRGLEEEQVRETDQSRSIENLNNAMEARLMKSRGWACYSKNPTLSQGVTGQNGIGQNGTDKMVQVL